MNAFNTVNLAAACIVTSTEYAKELGIPDSKWTYVLGGAGTSDSSECKCMCDSSWLGGTQLKRHVPPSLAPTELLVESVNIKIARCWYGGIGG